MKNSRLTRLLKTFSVEEWKVFEKFARSPYFNNGRNYLPLIKYFRKIIVKGSSENPELEKIYSIMYPGRAYNKNVINTILSGFSRLTESYLQQTDYDSSKQAKKIGLLRQFEKRNCDDLLLREISSVMKEIESLPFDLYKLDFMKGVQDYIVRSTYKSNYDKKIENPVIRRADYTFFIFYLNMLNEERDLRVLKNVLNKSYFDRLSALTVKNIDSNYILTYIDKYYPELSGTLGLLIKCYVSRNYFEIKKIYTENYQLLEPVIARNISYVIEGLLFDLLAEGKKEYLKERLLFLKFLAEKNLLVDTRSGIIPAQPVDNAVYYSFWNKDFDWLDSFIKHFNNSFPNELRTDLIRYANAHLLCGKGKYNEAIKEIKKIGNMPAMIKRRIKELELQILFELNEVDSLHYALDNYIKFMKNETVSPLIKQMMSSNINMFKSVLKFYFDNDKNEIISIQKMGKDTIPSQLGDWIIEKAVLLSGKNK